MRSPVRSRAAKLGTVLLLTMGLVVILAYEAWDAEHSHRTTAERVVRDYAAFAAWEYGANIKELIWSSVSYVFAPVQHGETLKPGERAKLPDMLLRSEAREKLCDNDVSPYTFRIDLRTRELLMAGKPPSEATQRWMRDTILVDVVRYGRDWSWSTVSSMIDGAPVAVVYQVKWDAWGKRAYAYGFEFCLKRLAAPIFSKVIEKYALLPPVLTRGAPNDSLLSLRLYDDHGRELYRTPWQYDSPYVGESRLESYGGLTTKVALNPALASSLIIGGLPSSRLPVLAGLLVATLVVLGAGMVVVRRESELARLRSDFVAGVSHELRTPLAQVRMFAETLRLGRVRSAQERDRSLAIIEQESHRLTHLVENVLQFSRAERQAIRLALRPRVLDEEIAGAMAAFTPLAEARGVRLEACLEPHVRAMVDADALRQILLNLLDNAVKYGPQGQTVRVAMGRRGATAMITVEDQGPGVPTTERARVWDAYYRMDRDVESAVAGGGIGLAVVRELVHGHGGSVDIDSATPHGARFIVTLPAMPEERSETPERTPAREGAPTETPA